jgi:putative hydroxymethylpyrimidine transport system substrate-binding protein
MRPRHHLPLRSAVAALIALVALALPGCGAKQANPSGPLRTERLDLVLDYFPNADHAGIYAAIGRGDFRRAGLEISPRAPSDPAAPLKLLAAGRADLAISYEPELLLARAKGLRLVSVGAIVQKPLTSIISLGKDAITRPSQLDGKTVGTAGIPYQEAYLRTILDRAGVDPARVKQVNVGFNLVPAMLSRKVDATLGAFWNYEGVELERRHKRPTVIRMERVGVPSYNELVVVAREAYVRDNGPTVRRFMQALADGTRALRADPETGVEPLLKANPDLDREVQLASVKRTLPVFFPTDKKRPFGYMDPVEWRDYARWMVDNRLIKTRGDRALTNEFLAGEGVGEGG